MVFPLFGVGLTIIAHGKVAFCDFCRKELKKNAESATLCRLDYAIQEE